MTPSMHELERLEKYSNNYDEYLKLLSFYKEANSFDYLLKRLSAYQTLQNLPFIPQKKLTEFENFNDLEKFSIDHKNWLNIYNHIHLGEDYQRELQKRLDLNQDFLKKAVRKFYPDIKQPHLDKAIFLFRNSNYGFSEVFNICKKWIDNKEMFQKLNISFDSYQKFHDIRDDVNHKLNRYQKVFHLVKKLPTAFRKKVESEIEKKNFVKINEFEFQLDKRFNEDAIRQYRFLSSLNDSYDSYEKIYKKLYKIIQIVIRKNCCFLYANCKGCLF